MQNKLFNIKPIRVPRPTIDNIDFTSVYEDFVDIISKWEKSNLDKEDKEDLVESLKKEFSVRDLKSDDAYRLGRKLESEFRYDVDINLVDELRVISHLIRTVTVEAEKNWIKECEIKPKYSIGDEVMVEQKGNKYIGRIAEIYYDRGDYSIYIEELHKGTNIIGTIKKFEEIEEDFFDKKYWEE